MEDQRVVVIQDASREVSSRAIRWALQGLSLKPGDNLTLLGVLHQVNTPSTLSIMGSSKPLGYKNRVDSSMFGANQKVVDIEAARKKEEYQNNIELIQISRLYETHKVEFKIEVATGPSPKVVALREANNLKATWVILDRKMKKDKRYFLQKLSCGISRMKRNNSIEELRGPKALQINKLTTEQSHNSQITYEEMIPGTPEDEELFSIEIFPRGQQHSTDDLTEERPAEEMFENSTCTICKNKRPKMRWKRDFTYAELQDATDRFSPINSLSESRHGYVYRGQLSNLTVVVKQHQNACSLGAKEFKSEVHKLSKARHKNVIMLLGSCAEGNHRLLVYEFACNGSLNHHLSKYNPTPLTWTQRIKIAVGVTRGLNYLHENNVIHRNIKPSNILLTHDREPLLGDFGLARLQYRSGWSSQHEVVGTTGYLAPECAENGKLSTKTDVYSFGIILLELITGRRTTDTTLGEKRLAGWAKPLVKERKYRELIDPRIANSHDAEQLSWMVQVACRCLSKNPKKRLTMDKVESALNYMTHKKTFVIRDFSPVKSCLVRSMSELNGTQTIEERLERESLWGGVRSSSITAQMKGPCSLASSSTISRTPAPSTGKSNKMAKAKSGCRIPVHYGEMLN